MELMHAPRHDKFLKLAVEIMVPAEMMEFHSATF